MYATFREYIGYNIKVIPPIIYVAVHFCCPPTQNAKTQPTSLHLFETLKGELNFLEKSY